MQAFRAADNRLEVEVNGDIQAGHGARCPVRPASESDLSRHPKDDIQDPG